MTLNEQNLLKLIRAMAESNLIGTDFKDVQIKPVRTDFVQDKNGYLVQFAVSAHAVGKIGADGQNALHDLREATE